MMRSRLRSASARSAATAAPPGGAGYVIFDADYPTAIWETLPPPMLDDRPMTDQDPHYPWFDKFSDLMPRNWLDSVQRAIDLGGIKRAETAEGLAAELGLDPGKLAEAITAWNAKAAAGIPDEFGRLIQNIKPIRKARRSTESRPARSSPGSSAAPRELPARGGRQGPLAHTRAVCRRADRRRHERRGNLQCDRAVQPRTCVQHRVDSRRQRHGRQAGLPTCGRCGTTA